jgi:hypothetical protein
LLSIGDDIIVIDEEDKFDDEDNINGAERRTEEVEEQEDENNYNYNYEGQVAAANEVEIRSTTLSFAESVCFEINALEHLQNDLRRNATVHYLLQTGIVLKDLSIVACVSVGVLVIGFLFVAYTYHARHKSRWVQNMNGPLSGSMDGKSFDEISDASTEAGFSVDESVPTPMAKC